MCIASSVPWLHQGAFFTYILIVILGLFKGNLIAPAFFTATLGILMQFELSNLVLLLFLSLVIPVFCFLIRGSPSESYLPVLFPVLTILFGFTAEKLMQIIKPSVAVIFVVILFLLFNVVFLFKNDFLVRGDKFSEIKKAAEFIIKDAQREDFNIIPMGSYTEFPSNKLNLVYLTGYLGHPPTDKKAKVRYFVYNSDEERIIKGAEKIAKFKEMTIFKKND